jgi:hypothetical protein
VQIVWQLEAETKLFSGSFPRLIFVRVLHAESTREILKGDKKLAIQSYEKLLQLWKHADADSPELIEAKARLAALRAESIELLPSALCPPLSALCSGAVRLMHKFVNQLHVNKQNIKSWSKPLTC